MTTLRPSWPCLLAALLALAGCAGRSEFRKGRELLARGEHRQAYYQFWEAAKERPCAEYLSALTAAGSLVAETERLAGLRLERRGDLDGALDRLALALEYLPGSPGIQEDHARIWGRIVRREALRQSLGGGEPQGSLEGPELFRRALEATELGAWEAPAEHALAGALRVRFEELFERLRRETELEALPSDVVEIARLRDCWEEAMAELEALAALEEETAFTAEPVSACLAGGGELRRAYLDRLGEVEGAAELLDRAEEGARRFAQGLEEESRGDLDRARESFHRAVLAHPSHIEAHSARRRVLARISNEAYHDAVSRARHGDARAALVLLDRALGASPAHVEAGDLRRSLARELSVRFALESRRLEDAGLLGGALVRALEARLEQPEDQSLAKAALRLEQAIQRRASLRWRIASRLDRSEDRRLRRDLWAVREEAVLAFEAQALKTASERLIASQAVRQPDSPEGSVLVEVTVDDFDFAFLQSRSAHGAEEARFVQGLELRPQRSLPALVQRATDLRLALDEALRLEAKAPSSRKEMALEEVRLLRLRLEQTEQLVEAASRPEPIVSWGTTRFPTQEVVTQAEAAARLRHAGSSWWVTVRLEERDRIVEGDPGHSVAPDALDALSRGEALRRLAPLLGEAIAAEIERKQEGRDEDLYREALGHIEAHSFDLATESLVQLLFARRRAPVHGGGDPLATEAARRLKGLTGCDLPALWAQLSSR